MVMGLIQLKNANKYFNSLSLPFYGPDAPPPKKKPWNSPGGNSSWLESLDVRFDATNSNKFTE